MNTTNFTDGWLDFEGNRIHYVTAGQGKPVVLLPGGPEDWQEWQSFMEEAAYQYKLIAFDYPGRGKTEYHGSRLTVKQCADVIWKSCQQLGLEESVIIGESFGGSVLFDLLENYKPKLSAVVFISAGEYFTPIQKKLFKTIFLPAYWKPIRLIYKVIASSPLGGSWSAAFRKLDDRQTRLILTNWLDLLSWRFRENPSIKFPVLILKGGYDKAVHKFIEKDTFPNAEVILKVLPYVGHDQIKSSLEKLNYFPIIEFLKEKYPTS